MQIQSLSKFQQRLIMSGICITGLLVTVVFSYHPLLRYLFISGIAAMVGVAVWEYYHIANVKGYRPASWLGISGATAFVFSSYLASLSKLGTALPLIVLGTVLLLTFLALFARKNDPHPMGNLAITLFGVVYLAFPLSCILMINYFFFPEGTQDGRLWLIYALALTKMTDTGAYFTGKTLGRTPLASDLSPKKTIEGAIGGMALALAASVSIPFLFSLFFPSSAFILPFGHQVFLGVVIGALAQVGDLAESLLKRDAGVKDSNQLPGLGGILDMVDSLIFTLPLFYFFLFVQYS